MSVEGLAEVCGLGADEEVVLVQDLLLCQLLVAVGVRFEDLKNNHQILKAYKVKQ